MDWLHDTTIRLATAAGLDTDDLVPDPKTRGALLKIARIAAHGSGDRTNAPLLCYVLGVMAARGYDVASAVAALEKP